MKNRVGAIIQARMGSKRLPGKVLKPILGIPMMGILLNRIKQCLLVDVIIVATSDEKQDDSIEDYINTQEDIFLYRGDENNVLERMYKAAENNQLSHILRVTGDNPFFDWKIADQLIEMILNEKYDFVANNITPTYPYGIDLEIMTFSSLLYAHSHSKDDYEKEHVTPYIRNNIEKFNLGSFENYIDLSNIRLTVDNHNDYNNAITIFETFGADVTFREIINS